MTTLYEHNGQNYRTEAEWLAASGPSMAYDGRYGLARDKDDENETFSDNPNAGTVAKMIAHGNRNFEPSDWEDLRSRAKDAHAACIARMGDDVDAMDTPPDSHGQAKRPGVTGDTAPTDFLARFPEAHRLRVDTMGVPARPIPTPKECVAHARRAVDGDDGGKGFFERFPGASKIGRM
jgi:hypothetical protein